MLAVKSIQVLKSTVKYRYKGKLREIVYYDEPQKARDKAAVLLMRGYTVVIRNSFIPPSLVPAAPSLTH